MNPKLKLSTARRDFTLRCPYFGMMALAIALRAVDGLGTFAMTDEGIMLYDPKIVEAWDLVKVSFVFGHELFHKWLKHAKRALIMGIPVGWCAMLWNTATDAYINRMLRDVYGWVPDDAILPERLGAKFKGFKLPGNVTAEEGYRLLFAAFPPPPPDTSDGKAGDGKGETCEEKEGPGEPKQGEDQKPEATKGWCGSAAGRPHPQESEHAPPGDEDGRGEVEFDGIIQDTARAIREHASKHAGTIPEEIGREADQITGPAVVPWHRQLRALGHNAVSTTMGAVDYRFGKGLSVRQAGMGYGDGVPLLPKLVAPQITVALATDTSGSMGSTELGEALREARTIFRMMGIKLLFLACDCQMHKIEPVKNANEMARKLHGGGGTSFVPVFEALDKMKRKPDLLVFFTDGIGVAPTQPPKGYQTIWVLLGHQQQVPFSEAGGQIAWGKHIRVPPSEAAHG